MKIVICDLLGLTYDGNTLKNRGLGGSESAVILISKELAAIGFDVTVLNNCIDSEATPGIYDGVRYIDHSQLDTYNDTPDIFIASRSVAPFWNHHSHANISFSAKKRILWLHDTFCEGETDLEAMIVGGYIDEVFTLSDFHSNYALNCDHGNKRNFEVLKNRFWQTRNGAVKHIEEVDLSKKDPAHYVYNASVTKGLIPLLSSIWPEVKKHIPTARLTVIGGYYRFRENAEPDEQEKVLKKLMTEEHQDVTFTGVIPQYEIAKILANASYMLYPTAFPETFGISSLESLLYKTPIITSRFGALEETAIDLACYKIDYSATRNVLKQNIDEQSQKQNYIKTIIQAHNTPYIHQQKQHYCDVINDIYGWDTVSLQWKQHFYNIMDIPLPVDEYRKVTRINDKVARVFRRRNSTPEQINQYKSSGLQNRILVVSPFWNAENYIEKNIKSVASQDYENYLHILIDDASTDNSKEVAQATIDSFPTNIQEKIILITNTDNKGCIKNQIDAINRHALNDDIVMLLDGDDWLVSNNTLFHYYNDLYNQGYEFTYGSMWSVVDNIPLIAQEYPIEVRKNKLYREHLFNWKIPYTHLRTVKGKHFNNLDETVFQVNGKWMKSGADNPLFYELIESVDADKIYCNREIVCNYNDANPLNDYKIKGTEQNSNASVSYKKKDEKVKTILVGIPTNKYIEPETFKSIFDLEVPDGYKLDFQYFYGYQIDQIRNLIAEWAKRYDYLFSVDSDIILPKDTLVKMLAADKDIISGLYIQRIPGTHTLELYMEHNGGSTNIPYNLIKDLGVVEIVGCGMGCALIKGDVFRNIPYPHFVYKSALTHTDTVSEDVYFCMNARQHGFTVWADPSIKCDHKGSTYFTVDEPQAEAVIEDTLTHLEKVSIADLLPTAHAEYLKTLDIEPKVIYDIGACVLHWTRKAKETWPDAEFYLLDAAQSVQPFLAKSNSEWAISVLSDTDGKVLDFYEDVNNPGGNSYYLETTGAFTDQHKTRRITSTLDTLVKQNNWKTPDLMKVDVQGAEMDVLNGAKETIKQCNDIILECQHTDYNEGAPKIDQMIEYMNQIGFELVAEICRNENDGDYHFRRVY